MNQLVASVGFPRDRGFGTLPVWIATGRKKLRNGLLPVIERHWTHVLSLSGSARTTCAAESLS